MNEKRNGKVVCPNFLHGRVSSSVFMRNYFNPVWISDLKERTFKAVAGIVEGI
jgi:hypothetical protein